MAAAYARPGDGLPITGFGAPGDPPSPAGRDSGRRFSVAWIQQLKSRASTRVACDHGTSTAQVNLNQRKRSMPYDRSVAVDLPAA